jgi:hypothetical protein
MQKKMKPFKGSLGEWLLAAILALAGIALLHARWTSDASASEGAGDPADQIECQM